MDSKTLELIFGTTDLRVVIVGFIFSLFGALLSLLLDSNTRDLTSPRTPVKYSYKFLFLDNARRLLISVLLLAIFIRFTKELLGVDITTYWAFFIGFCSDKLSGYLKSIKQNFFANGKSYNELIKENNIPAELVEIAINIEENPNQEVELVKDTKVIAGENKVQSNTSITQTEEFHKQDI